MFCPLFISFLSQGTTVSGVKSTPPKFNMEPENGWFPRGASFSRDFFSDSMLNFEGVATRGGTITYPNRLKQCNAAKVRGGSLTAAEGWTHGALGEFGGGNSIGEFRFFRPKKRNPEHFRNSGGWVTYCKMSSMNCTRSIGFWRQMISLPHPTSV